MDEPNQRAEGPGAVSDTTSDVKPLLEGATENEYAEILNPLSVPFIGRVASSRPIQTSVRVVVNSQTPTMTRTEEDIRRNYGLDLNNPDHPSLGHVSQSVEIKPGATVRLPGNEAQVIIRQLVNVIMAKEGKKLFMGDPHARKEVEERIVIKRGSLSEFFGTESVNIREEINKDLETADEPEFPEAGSDPSGKSQGVAEPDRQPANGSRRGRPPKAQTVAADAS